MAMKSEKEILIEHLKKRNLKLTVQRELILKVFLSIEKHLSVEDLYEKVKVKNSSVGQVTVFRTLKLFKACGLAREVNFKDGRIRYEHLYAHQHHDHLICTGCGKFIEIYDSRIEKLQIELCRKKNFYPFSHRLEIFGFCTDCNDKNQKV